MDDVVTPRLPDTRGSRSTNQLWHVAVLGNWCRAGTWAPNDRPTSAPLRRTSTPLAIAGPERSFVRTGAILPGPTEIRVRSGDTIAPAPERRVGRHMYALGRGGAKGRGTGRLLARDCRHLRHQCCGGGGQRDGSYGLLCLGCDRRCVVGIVGCIAETFSVPTAIGRPPPVVSRRRRTWCAALLRRPSTTARERHEAGAR